MSEADLKPLNIKVFENFRHLDEDTIDVVLAPYVRDIKQKIVILDDDPTGVQTVNDVYVYTDWEVETIKKGLEGTKKLFFILTNSRGLTVPETRKVHTEIAHNLAQASRETGVDFIIISRSDSTLRGHYPLETEVLRDVLEEETGNRFNGEIIFPYFLEGGRFTMNNVHYVKDGDMLIPAAQTEFAKDKSFGYTNSDLRYYVEEKTRGEYRAEDVTCISLQDLRDCEIDKIANQLIAVHSFNKIIVNAISCVDVKVFCMAFCKALQLGRKFIFRSAGSLCKVIGGVKSRPLLTKRELVLPGNTNGGIVLIGSHVKKTTQQFNELKNCKYPLEYIEFHAARVLEEGGLEDETKKVIAEAESYISQGKSVVVYTSRELVKLDTTDKDEILKASVAISNALVAVIGDMTIKPNFIIAKGGITSSDVGTKALRVKRARVMGQIKPGIPVWMTGDESKFPYMPYVIFPGNVGEVTTLREAVEVLMEED